MGYIRDAAPGIAITLTIAMIASLTSSLHPSFDSLVISIIFGMLVSNMFTERGVFEKGIDAALKIFLPVGIGLLGMQITVSGAGIRPWPILPALFASQILIFLTTYYISRGFGLDQTLSILLSTGLSVCGASAIIVIAPLLEAKKEDTSISIISIMTVGLTGMLIFGFLPGELGLSMTNFAFLTGATLPMFGQVKVASAAMGEECLALASNLKLLRMASLVVLAGLALAFSGKRQKRVYMPWFMAVFFMLAVAVNLSWEVATLRRIFSPISSFSLSAALAAVGLSLDFESITEKGIAPLFAAFLSWGIIIMGIYLILSLTV